jgi:hypothetical protein
MTDDDDCRAERIMARQALLEMAKTWIQATLEVERGLGLIDEGTPLRNL